MNITPISDEVSSERIMFGVKTHIIIGGVLAITDASEDDLKIGMEKELKISKSSDVFIYPKKRSDYDLYVFPDGKTSITPTTIDKINNILSKYNDFPEYFVYFQKEMPFYVVSKSKLIIIVAPYLYEKGDLRTAIELKRGSILSDDWF